MSRKRGALIVAGIAAVLLLVTGAYYLYWSYHPYIYLSGSSPIGFRPEDQYSELIMLAYSEHRGIPIAKSVQKEIQELGDWGEQVTAELYSYYTVATPYSIHVSGENNNGHVTLRYEGYVTTKDGERLDYYQEQTFDLFVRDKDFRVKARGTTDER